MGLQESLHSSFSLTDISLFKKIFPQCSPDQQLKMLQRIQVIVHGMLSLDVENLHGTFHSKEEHRQEVLYMLVGEQQDGVMIYEFLYNLLSLPFGEFTRLCDVLLQLGDIQIIQMVNLLQLNIFDIKDVRQLLTPRSSTCNEDMDESDTKPSGTENMENASISLTIVDRLPDEAVYRRNLRPNPSVSIVGPKGKHSGKELFRVTPVVCRCDTLEEIAGALIGDHSQTGTVGSTLKFPKLKIQYTSHQVNDSLFCIRFMLHRNSEIEKNSNAAPISFVQSTPIKVVSHSSLISNPEIAVTEIIPPTGGVQEFTRVAILGKNFPESSHILVSFDGVEVSPEVCTSSTIICYAPPHYEGEISVSVSDKRHNPSSGKNSIRFHYVPNHGITYSSTFTPTSFDFEMPPTELDSIVQDFLQPDFFDMT